MAVAFQLVYNLHEAKIIKYVAWTRSSINSQELVHPRLLPLTQPLESLVVIPHALIFDFEQPCDMSTISPKEIVFFSPIFRGKENEIF